LAVVRAEDEMNKLAYKIISIRADLKSDEAVVSKAEKVINEYADLGWRLHTYSYVAADSGGFSHGVLGQYTATNLLHLVFEKERPLTKAEISLINAQNELEQKKADAAAYLEEMRNKRANEQG
jgi:hypothetical protein